MKQIVVCITGASGTIYGIKLIEELSKAFKIHLIVSNSGYTVMEKELNIPRDIFIEKLPKNILIYREEEIDAPISSGSFLVNTEGVIVSPCSVGTLGSIANGISTNLIHRVCEVALKERKKLYLLVREMPLSLIQIKNMEKITLAGGTVAVASPAFYNKPENINDMINFVIGKVLDHFEINHNLYKRWSNENF